MSSINFGELEIDTKFKTRVEEFHASVDKVGTIVDNICSQDIYDQLTPQDKVRYNLFLSFSINSLFWLYLRTQGVDPNTHELKGEITRVKEYMSRATQLYEKQTIMPRIDKEAAQRFVRNGLWTPKENDANAVASCEPNPRKRKREDGDENES